MRKNQLTAAILRGLVYAAAGVTAATAVGIVAYILIKGVPQLTPSLFSLHYTSENCSVLPALINTVTMVLLSLLIAVPFGVCAAIYLAEYAKKDNRFVKVVRVTAETLSGIPSIVYGLFGCLLFRDFLGFGYSMLAGALTLSVMVLPVIMRTTEEALMSVPDAFREGSFGLGAGKLRTITRVVLPSAVPGIFAGVILAIGRIVGETAALLFTAGSVAQVAGLNGSGRTLAVHLYALWNEGLNMEKAYATAVILLVLVILINALSTAAEKKIRKGTTE